ncbi:MAG: tRNA pseudouridine(38-40) synthase TruA [Chloroflexota bacterium]
MGTAYAGFQRQPGKVTVQSVIEESIATVTQEYAPVVASGRTDAGAHALGQVIAFSSLTRLQDQVLQRALNATLPRDIVVTHVQDVAADFHPRFDAHSRTYRYLLYNRHVPSPLWRLRAAHVRRPLDVGAMAEAASALLGRHNFAAFVPAIQAVESTRTFYSSHCRRRGDLIAVDLRASGFKRQMVRSIVGTLIWAGEGKIGRDDFSTIMASGDRRRAGETMPAHGLYLLDVHYPADKLTRSEPAARGDWQDASLFVDCFEENA